MFSFSSSSHTWILFITATTSARRVRKIQMCLPPDIRCSNGFFICFPWLLHFFVSINSFFFSSLLFLPMPPIGRWREKGSEQSCGEVWRSTKTVACRCSPRLPGTNATSRSEENEGTRPHLHPRRRLTPTSLSPKRAGPPLELGRAPPRCCSSAFG